MADSKREEFRKYLEKAGVLDAITKGDFHSEIEILKEAVNSGKH